MSVVTYLVTDTVNNTVNFPTLIAAIEKASFAAVFEGAAVIDDEGTIELQITFDFPLTGLEKTTLDGIVATHTGAPTTREFQFTENGTVHNTTSQGFQTPMSVTAPPMTAGVYVVWWQCECQVVAVGGSPHESWVEIRGRVDSSAKALGVRSPHRWDGWHMADKIVLSEGDTPLLELQFRRDPTAGGDDQVEVRKLKIGLQLTS